MGAQNTLGLDDDLDSVELLMRIEQAFGVRISEQDANTLRTVGDLHHLLASKLQGIGGERCRTSMAFHRVHRALKDVIPDKNIRPSTPLRDIWSGPPRILFERAQSHCELILPALQGTKMRAFGAIMILAALVAAPIMLLFQVNLWLTLALAGGLGVVGSIPIRLDPLAFGSDIQTVGDLARRVASQNYGVLARAGGRSDEEAVWDALLDVIGGGSDAPLDEITPGTFILASELEKLRKPESRRSRP